ncbi:MULTISPECIES: methyl-accepting chemotaxis protein [unclassified Duganella]|uniref:methyl-accepting chemotaxis protein n=1 Tax=unclassified Duganella TaxID=2636909 RepID=UPI0006F478FC|nr:MULTISPECIES: methyl-accepting chemotaxis protein [unclassified Duganella]KQV46427.1 chemotaxis protein [Duganella sp. Root336D2]KRC02219.1 chemotaxis protein [Duganella sp. Root198D2]
MRIANLKIGTRLGLCFAIVFALMAMLIAVGSQRLSSIGELSSTIIDKDWVKADAAATVSATTRANAALVLQLLLVTDTAQGAQLRAQVDRNKAIITDALAKLDKLVYRPAGRELLAQVSSDRSAYVQSFTGVLKLLADGQREQATQRALSETMPRLAKLQASVEKLADLQDGIVTANGAEIKQHISSARAMMIALGVSALVLGAACALWVTRSITRPINYALQVARTVASGDLSSQIKAQSQDEAGQLLHALRDMNDALSQIVGQVRNGTVAIASASGEIATGNMDLSARTENQASALEETASSMEELTSTVKANADNAREADKLASSASSIAQRGGEVVSQVVTTMGSINDSSRKVVDIIAVIDGIAFQTNILALNAAVEAARAGEQGRGFAVVASEVRNLAARSASAAKEIKALISSSVEQVDAGAKLVAQAGATMEEVVSAVQRVTGIVAEISLATREQTDGIEQMNTAIMQMDQTTQQNAALVEQAAAAASAMSDQAGELETLVSQFRLAGETAGRKRPALPAQQRNTPRLANVRDA